MSRASRIGVDYSRPMFAAGGPSPVLEQPPPGGTQGVASRDGDFRMFGLAMVAGAGALSVLPAMGPLCPLRRTTGVPCPFCGMTTGSFALVRGDVFGAFAANPLAPILLLVVLLACIPPLWRAAASLQLPPSIDRNKHLVPWLLLAPLWLFQLHRFEYL